MNSWKTPSPPDTGASRSFHETLPRPRRPRGLVGEIVESLAASIREGQLQPGAKLPTETEIMARFDVSRTVVRESLSRLQASGLVESAPSAERLGVVADDVQRVVERLSA